MSGFLEKDGSNGTSVPTIVLIREQNDEQDMVKNMLVGQGYRVCEGHSVGCLDPKKLAVLPDLVILAAGLGDEVAREVCRWIASNKDTESVPILLVCQGATCPDWIEGMPIVFDLVTEDVGRRAFLSRVKVLLRVSSLSSELSDTHKRLLQAQRLECVGALAAGVAHEFNNLMCAVMGFAEMARSGGGTDIEALRESAEVSYQAAERATTTAACLLAFTREVKTPKNQGDMNEAVMAAVRLLRRNLERSGVTLDVDLADLPPTAFGAGPMQQVFLNLIINAWHALEGSSERKISIRSEVDSSLRIVVTIADTGYGISKEVQARMFDAFFTTKNAEDSSTEGTGLGLSVVREVVRDHNGVVEVESEEGQGACFKITLPVMQAETDVDEAVTDDLTSKGQSVRSYSVLIVDDEESNRRILSRLLIKCGHDAYSAGTMAEATTLLWSQKIDLIIMDMIMPDSDGVTNIALIREMGIETPVLICTGQMDGKTIARGLEAGAASVVWKPFSAAEFMSAMMQCLEPDDKG